MKHTTTLLAAGLLAAAATFASGPAGAQTILKASDVHPAGYPTVVAVENIGKKLSDATKGKLSVAMYPSMQLGGEKEAIEQAQVGAIAFARVSVGALGPVVDALNVVNLPYVFSGTAQMRKVVDGPIGQELLDDVTNSGKGLVGLAWMDAGARNFYDTKHADQNHRRPQGLEDPRDRQPDVRRHGQRHGRQRHRDGLRSGILRAANRRHRRRREQSAELRVR